LQPDGSATVVWTEPAHKALQEAIQNSGIRTIDMSVRFLSEYQSNHILPEGFLNTSVGKGHLNQNGHRMVADALFQELYPELSKEVQK
jgi:hypothetical protein